MHDHQDEIRRQSRNLGRKDTLLLAVFVSSYLLSTFWISSGRELWYDEFYAHYIGGLSSFTDIWRALSSGADNHPPLNYWLTHLSYSLFGPSFLTLRLHSTLAVCGGLILLYLSVKKITGSSLASTLAFLIPLTTPLYYYGYEARGYALLFFLSTLLYYSWVLHLHGRRGALLLIAGSAILLPYAHFYGVLSIAPLVIDELLFLFRERRIISKPLLVVLGATALSVLSLLPIILSAKQYATQYFWHPAYFKPLFEEVYNGLFPSIGFVAAITALLALCPVFRVRHEKEEVEPRDQRALFCAVVFLTLPLFQFVLARFVTKAFYFRYALPTLIAVGIVPPCILAYHRARPLILALLFVLSPVAAYNIRSSFNTPHRFIAGSSDTKELARAASVEALQSGGPVVVNGFELPALYEGVDRRVKGRVVFVLDEEKDLTPNPPAMRGLSQVSGIKIISLKDAVGTKDRLILVNPPSWLTEALRKAGKVVELRWSSNEDYIFSSY